MGLNGEDTVKLGLGVFGGGVSRFVSPKDTLSICTLYLLKTTASEEAYFTHFRKRNNLPFRTPEGFSETILKPIPQKGGAFPHYRSICFGTLANFPGTFWPRHPSNFQPNAKRLSQLAVSAGLWPPVRTPEPLDRLGHRMVPKSIPLSKAYPPEATSGLQKW